MLTSTCAILCAFDSHHLGRPTPVEMPGKIKNYGVWVAKPTDMQTDRAKIDDKSPHIELTFTDDAGDHRAAINVKSTDKHDSRLVYWLNRQLQHTITDNFQNLTSASRLSMAKMALILSAKGWLELKMVRCCRMRRQDQTTTSLMISPQSSKMALIARLLSTSSAQCSMMMARQVVVALGFMIST